VWLPVVVSLAAITFRGPRSCDLAADFRYSAATGTGAVIGGLKKGDSYQISAVVPPKPDAGELKKLAPGPASAKPTGPVPSVISSAASTLSEGAGSPYEKVEAIRNALATKGLLSHGDTRPSASGHGYDRLLKLLNGKDLIGDAEQFAPAMALMVQSLGIPARVVMGFAPKGMTPGQTVTVRGSDITAWVEVQFDKVGWVAFDPNPDESNKEREPQPKAKVAARQQAMQPPPPPRVPEDADTSDVDETNKDKKENDKKKDDKKQDGSAGEGVNWVLAAGVGVPSLLVVVPIGAILLLKTRRRRRRRGDPEPSRRMAGGWDQLIDGAIDLGTTLPSAATRREAAGVIDERFGGDTVQLARAADSGVFAPDAADDDAATRYWADVDGALKHLGGQVGTWRRLRAKLSLASLRGRRIA
jgi:transglutaminase-like putative cysteine protease